MKTFIAAISFLFCIQITSSAQTTATWSGGTPGRTQDWNCPTNWKEGRVPDEFSQVIIPSDRHVYPVIRTAVDDIDALRVDGGGQLTVSDGGQLTVLGESGRFNGMSLLGLIQNNGVLRYEAMGNASPMISGNLSGIGTFIDLSRLTADKN